MKKFELSFYSWSGTFTIQVSAMNENGAVLKALLLYNQHRVTRSDLKYVKQIS